MDENERPRPEQMRMYEIAREMRQIAERKEAFAYGEGEYWQHDDDRFFELGVQLTKAF